jgi:hypothetical protein
MFATVIVVLVAVSPLTLARCHSVAFSGTTFVVGSENGGNIGQGTG